MSQSCSPGSGETKIPRRLLHFPGPATGWKLAAARSGETLSLAVREERSLKKIRKFWHQGESFLAGELKQR